MSGFRSVMALAVAAALFAAAPGPGEGSVEDEVLEALIAEALEKNPEIRALQASVEAARKRPQVVSALPNPAIDLAYTNDGWSPSLGAQDMTTLALMGRQELPYPGKRRLRRDIAQTEARAVEQVLERAKLGLVARVRRAYAELRLARQLLELLGEEGQIWEEIEGVSRARYAVGQGAQQDVLRVQVEVTRVEQRREERSAEAEARLADLLALLARPAGTPIEALPPLELRPELRTLDAVLGEVQGASPELRASALGIDTAGLQVALARKARRPDFSLTAGVMNRGGLDPMWQAGVGLSLPLWRGKNDAAVAEASLLAVQAERVAEALRLALRGRTEARFVRLRSLERVAQLYERGIVPQDQMALESAVASYQAGKVPFVTVLESLNTLYADRTALARTLAAHERARAVLDEGSLSEEGDSMSSGSGASRPSSVVGTRGAAEGAAMSMGNR